MNLHSVFRVQHPAAQIMHARKTIHERAETDALDDSAHGDGIGLRHEFYFAFTTQPRPCHPTWITLPYSTSKGTVNGGCVNRCRRSRAAVSLSISYSTNSRFFHSSHSRISLV